MSTRFTPQDESLIGLDLHPAPFTNRFLAWFIESLCLGLVSSAIVDIALLVVQGTLAPEQDLLNGEAPYSGAAEATLCSILWLWMRVHYEMRGKATFGKSICKIRPHYCGTGPSLSRVLVRNIWLVADLLTLAYAWIRGFYGDWGPMESASSVPWLLLVAFTCLFDKRSRSLADRWAVVEFVRT